MGSTELLHTISLLKKQYPFGIPKAEYTAVKKVVFFSRNPLTVAEQELLMGAGVKGLKLHPQEFRVEIGTRQSKAVHLVICGDTSGIDMNSKELQGSIHIAPPVLEILSDPEKKKQFWELIKPFGAK